MNNKLMDLNNQLFKELDRLSNEGIKGEELSEEIDRARAVCGVGRVIIDNAILALDAQKALDDSIHRIPEMIGVAEKIEPKPKKEK